MKMTDEESLLRRMGAEVESPDTGCCGMAGPFGFEAAAFAVSQAIGERVLLPAVRRGSRRTHRGRRIQLPRADSPVHGPARDAPGRSAGAREGGRGKGGGGGDVSLVHRVRE
jgi:hypothetical protein